MIPDLAWAALAAGCTAAALIPLLPTPVRVPGGTVRPPARTATGRRRRPRSDDPAAWADLLDAIAAEVRAGSSLAAAVEHVAQRHEGDDAAVALHALGAAAVLGGPVAATLQHGSLVLRDRHAAQSEAAAHSAQARLSATVLTVLPVAFTTVAFVTSGSFRQAASSAPGLVCIGLGGALNLGGRRWMTRLVAGAHR